MIYAQIKSGQKLHYVYTAGEGRNDTNLVKAGHVSAPICGRAVHAGYRMTINVPLGNACKNCMRVLASRP